MNGAAHLGHTLLLEFDDRASARRLGFDRKRVGFGARKDVVRHIIEVAEVDFGTGFNRDFLYVELPVLLFNAMGYGYVLRNRDGHGREEQDEAEAMGDFHSKKFRVLA